MGADLGPAPDQPLLLEDGQRFANGVAGERECSGQVQFGRQAARVGVGVDLLAQHVGDPPGANGPGALTVPDGYWMRHAATLTQLRGLFRAADESPRRRLGVLRRAAFGPDQRKPRAAAPLRHLGQRVGFVIRVSRTRRALPWACITSGNEG